MSGIEQTDLPVELTPVTILEEGPTLSASELARTVLPGTIAREETRQQEILNAAQSAASIAKVVLVTDGQKRSQAVDETHAKYMAEPSKSNLRFLRDAIETYAFAPTIQLTNNQEVADWDALSKSAAKHCVRQVQKYKPKEYNGRIVRFSTWAAKVIRNKVRDENRKLTRKWRRERRQEAKRLRKASEEILRKRKEHREVYTVEFSEADVSAVIKKLRPAQAELLQLKSKTPRLLDSQIAAKLGVTLPQLRNRWSRLRKKMKARLEAIARLERLLTNAEGTKWYPGNPNTPYAVCCVPSARSKKRGPRGVFRF